MNRFQNLNFQGDSGGGLIAQFEDFNGQKRWYLLGAVSFGADCFKMIQGRERPEGQVLMKGKPFFTFFNNFPGLHECDLPSSGYRQIFGHRRSFQIQKCEYSARGSQSSKKPGKPFNTGGRGGQRRGSSRRPKNPIKARR